ncbi:hypothetical protein LJC48_03465 [Desulfovibrio sp. OttesenSCG-928-C06]|nr:hypothetical protein [Desulfovibrio sp. OttesenSCG-928-C06]
MPTPYAQPGSLKQTGRAILSKAVRLAAKRLLPDTAGLPCLPSTEAQAKRQKLAGLAQRVKLAGIAGIFALVFLTPVISGTASALPVSTEQARNGAYLASSALYLADPESGLGIEQAGSPLLQSQYVKLSEGIPLDATGTLWLRFSLINGLDENTAGATATTGTGGTNGAGSTATNGAQTAPAAGQSPDATATQATSTAAKQGGIVLRLPSGSPAAKMFVAKEISPKGEVRSWREIMPQEDGSFKLPDPRKLPLTVYVKLAGIPGPWFNPQLAGAEQEASSMERYLPWALCALLGLGVLVCLLRGLAERAEWRLWGSAVIGCALVQAVFLRHATDVGGIYLTTLPQLLAPGLAIMLVPHVGRHLMRSRESKPLDYLLIFFSLIGVAAALLPLVPGFGWTLKLLPLAPLLLLPVLITACVTILRARPGSLTFMLLCLFPLLGAGLSASGLGMAVLQYKFEHPLYLLGTLLPLLGYAVAGLLMAAAAPRRHAGDEKSDFFPLNIEGEQALALEGHASSAPESGHLRILSADEIESQTDEDTACTALADATTTEHDNGEHTAFVDNSTAFSSPGHESDSIAITPETPGDAPQETGYQQEITENAAVEALEQDPAPDLDAETLPHGEESTEYPESTDSDAQTAQESTPIELPEGELVYIRDQEEPGLTIIKPRSALSLAELHDITESEPPFAAAKRITGPSVRTVIPSLPDLPGHPQASGSEFMEHEDDYAELRRNIEDMKQRQGQAENLTENLEDILDKLGDALARMDRITAVQSPDQGRAQSIFNLSNLIRKAHAEVIPLAEGRGVTLSWFVSPSLPLLYKGDEDSIRSAITYMLQGAVESAEAGAVQLSVRQSPEGGEGFIRFSLTDSSMSPNSMRKPARLLSRAWELARASQGSFTIEFVPSRGTSIHFSLLLRPLVEDEDAWIQKKDTPMQLARLPWDDEGPLSIWSEQQDSSSRDGAELTGTDSTEEDDVAPLHPVDEAASEDNAGFSDAAASAVLQSTAEAAQPVPAQDEADAYAEDAPDTADAPDNAGPLTDEAAAEDAPEQQDESAQPEDVAMLDDESTEGEAISTDDVIDASEGDSDYGTVTPEAIDSADGLMTQDEAAAQDESVTQGEQLALDETNLAEETAPQSGDFFADGTAPSGHDDLHADQNEELIVDDGQFTEQDEELIELPVEAVVQAHEAHADHEDSTGQPDDVNNGTLAEDGITASDDSATASQDNAQDPEDNAAALEEVLNDENDAEQDSTLQEQLTDNSAPDAPEDESSPDSESDTETPDALTLAMAALSATVQKPVVNLEPRTEIVIADMAASGRRLIERRLSGLPHLRCEARSPEEIVRACAGHSIGLIILDADMPEEDVREALLAVNAAEANDGWPPVPSLCLLSHSSQEERMLLAGCTACQVKTASRNSFQELVLRLAPHHAAQPVAAEQESATAPTSQNRQTQQVTLAWPAAPGHAEQPDQPEDTPEPLIDAFEGSRFAADAEAAAQTTSDSTADAPHTAAKSEKPDRSVPMLDLIVSSLDAESAENADNTENAENAEAEKAVSAVYGTNGYPNFAQSQQEAQADAANGSEPKDADSEENAGRTRLSGLLPDAPAEYMDSSMLSFIPGFLEVLQETITDLAKGVNSRNATLVQDVSLRMRIQGETFGLSNLERMASCVERAAEAEDQEAIGDLAEELLNLGNRYLTTLRLTYQDWEKNQ